MALKEPDDEHGVGTWAVLEFAKLFCLCTQFL